jgi:hypothetical protein
MATLKQIFLLLAPAMILSAADPTIVVSRRQIIANQEYLLLGIQGESDSHLQNITAQGEAVITVIPKPGKSAPQGCNSLPVQFAYVNEWKNATILLTKAAQSCLDAARKNPDDYLAPALHIPRMQYKGKTLLNPTAIAIPNSLQIAEKEDESVIDASKLVFDVIYWPWENDPKPLKDFLDPTLWCVAAPAQTSDCADQLSLYREALRCSALSGQGQSRCLADLVKAAPDYAEIIERWTPLIQNHTLGCKDLNLRMSVAKVSYDPGAHSLKLLFCRSAFYTKANGDDDFEVLWFGETGDKPQTNFSETKDAFRATRPVVSAFQSQGYLQSQKLPNSIRFHATNPLAPSGNELYFEAFFRSDRAAFAPEPDVKNYSSTTTLHPSLSTRQLYSFRFEGSYLHFGDVPLGSGRKWSMGVTPSMSALFSSGGLATDPNSVSLRLPLQIVRSFSDRSCRFTMLDGNAQPNRSCNSPRLLRRFTLAFPGVIESTKTGTTKNALFSPTLGLQLRPIDIFEMRANISGAAGFEIGRRITQVQFPGDAAAIARPDGIRRVFIAPTIAIKPIGAGRITASLEYKFVQLLRDEIHQSPADTIVYIGDATQCAPKDSCVLQPKDGVVKNFAKGSRQWLNAQVSFDLSNQLSLITGYRRGRLAPLYVYTNQFAVGIAFHLDPKAKPKLPFKQ